MLFKRNKRKALKAEIIEGREASEALIKDMWGLRLDFLKLTLSKEDDWRKFFSICRKENTLLIVFRDLKGGLQGYYTFSFNPVHYDGKKALLIHSKYYYVRPEFRGHPTIPSSAWKLLPGIIWRFGFLQLYFVAFSFPTSYVSLSRTFGRVMTLQQGSTPGWELRVLEAFVLEQSGGDWDDSRKLIVNQNVPVGEDRPASDSVQELRRVYEGLNPNWAEGVSLPIMMRFDWQTIKSVLGTGVRRSKR